MNYIDLREYDGIFDVVTELNLPDKRLEKFDNFRKVKGLFPYSQTC